MRKGWGWQRMTGLQEQMSSMKRERDAANKRLVKSIKLEKGPTFKKSNKK